MSKKRVHEIAKEHNMSSKELLDKLKAAGIDAKAAASSVEEDAALKALGLAASSASSNGAPAAPVEPAQAKPPSKQAPPSVRHSQPAAPAPQP